jgi:2-polyprenyl-6-methoxyphenol hydroxylase-like FAD-dependent oxidoreductase
MKPRCLTIVGGGIAGLTLGIALRKREVPVVLWESGSYPRHRVCGEFISGRGQAVLQRLGLLERILKAGAIPARKTAFFINGLPGPARSVQPPALCLSRYKMDELLALEFVELGGELRERSTWKGNFCAQGVVQATGRECQRGAPPSRWFGIKAHTRELALCADLEMHCLPNQYVGVGRVEDGKINVCGLFRRNGAEAKAGASRQELLLGPVGSSLRKRLEGAMFDPESFCSIAGLPLEARRARGRRECRIGDCLTMIPPITGNGMSMAMEAAAAAARSLEQFSRGELSWDAARAAIARSCDRLFWQRLRWAGWLQRLLFLKPVQNGLGRLLLRSGLMWKLLFCQTR